MGKVRLQVPALAALVDFWGQGVDQDLVPFLLTPRGQPGGHECLLPMVSWAPQGPRPRGRRRQAKRPEAVGAVRAACEQPPITPRLAPHVLAAWQAWATDRVTACQRASSAVEGRNGVLSPLHHKQRGLPKPRYKGWTVWHNFDCHAPDGTTPASRFFRRTFPEVGETVLAHIAVLPRARQRKNKGALCH